MIEGRIHDAAETILRSRSIAITKGILRTVATEARKEGIDEMADVICKFAPALRIAWVRAEAERLKEQGK